ncbi:MAG: DUF4347 domain-containing protein [Leptolyngbya sp. SIOISBB]|nr:DUF4347 domain-containing protein [Leptolyngbya sp. SIOISBB]
MSLLNFPATTDHDVTVTDGVHLVAIAAQVEDYASLIRDVIPGAQVVILDAEQNGIAQLTHAIQQAQSTICSLHIISHGAPGQLFIGNEVLNAETLARYAAQITGWQEFFTADTDILIYGCEVAKGEIGQALIQQLQQLTHANVAASHTLTGNSDQGGNSHLEWQLGQVTTPLISFENYSGVLTAFGAGNSQQLWLKADAGVTEAGGNVTAWADQSGNGQNGTGFGDLTRNVGVLNGNDTIEFDGTGDYFDVDDGFADFTGGVTAFVVARPDNRGTPENFTRFFHFDVPGNVPTDATNAILFYRHQNTDNLGYATVGAVANNFDLSQTFGGGVIDNSEFQILGVVQDDTTAEVDFLRNGESRGTANGVPLPTNVTRTRNLIGRSHDPANDPDYDGQIAEILIFNDDLTDLERRKVETYLAIKYGTTLGTDYTSTAGTVIFDTDGVNNNYANDIFGIGIDNTSTLNQAQSRSINTDSIVTIGGASDLANGEFLIVGNDDGNANFAAASTNIPTDYLQRLNRIWQAAETGEVGTVNVSFDLTGLGYNLANINDFALLIDTDTDFSNAAVFTGGRTLNGNVVTFIGVNFANGNTFTLATNAVPNAAPTDLQFQSAVTNLNENVNTTSRIKLADLVITDNNTIGTNAITLTGADAAKFEVDGTELFLRAGTTLDFETQSLLQVNVEVDDATVGATPDLSRLFQLTINDVNETTNAIFNFEQWMSLKAISLFKQGISLPTIFTGTVYQSTLVEFNVEIGGLRIAPLFDESAYLSKNLDVAAAVQQGIYQYGFEHFVLFGMNEGRSPSNWFDEQYYLAQNADVAAAVSIGQTTAIAHFLHFGHRENRDPSAFFDADDYLLKNPDVKASVDGGLMDSAFEHYIELGAEQGLQAGLLFDESFYLQQNPDVAAAVQAGTFALGLYHFLFLGQSEGRDPSSLFDQSAYLARYGDVAAAVAGGAFTSGFEHYILAGRAEGRIAV